MNKEEIEELKISLDNIIGDLRIVRNAAVYNDDQTLVVWMTDALERLYIINRKLEDE